jgi:hypothetical protein
MGWEVHEISLTIIAARSDAHAHQKYDRIMERLMERDKSYRSRCRGMGGYYDV